MFSVLAGTDGRSYSPDLNLETVKIPEGNYLVFSHKGEMPQIAIDAWKAVWDYFSDKDCMHERLYQTDFEYYPNGNQIDVHIGVKESL